MTRKIPNRRRISDTFDISTSPVRDAQLGSSFVAGDHARAGSPRRFRRLCGFGNNAGQGLALAKSLRSDLIGQRGAVIYRSSLPEIDAYRRLGYRAFFPRSERSPISSGWLKAQDDRLRSASLTPSNTTRSIIMIRRSTLRVEYSL
jgi:hypothetical protein